MNGDIECIIFCHKRQHPRTRTFIEGPASLIKTPVKTDDGIQTHSI